MSRNGLFAFWTTRHRGVNEVLNCAFVFFLWILLYGSKVIAFLGHCRIKMLTAFTGCMMKINFSLQNFITHCFEITLLADARAPRHCYLRGSSETIGRKREGGVIQTREISRMLTCYSCKVTQEDAKNRDSSCSVTISCRCKCTSKSVTIPSAPIVTGCWSFFH